MLELYKAQPRPYKGIFLLNFEGLRVVVLGQGIGFDALIELAHILVRIEAHEHMLVNLGILEHLIAKHLHIHLQCLNILLAVLELVRLLELLVELLVLEFLGDATHFLHFFTRLVIASKC